MVDLRSDLFVEFYEGHTSGMSCYHNHNYYELSLIIAGNIRVMLKNQVQYGDECRIVLTRPGTPHCVTVDSCVLYKRINIYLTDNIFTDVNANA